MKVEWTSSDNYSTYYCIITMDNGKKFEMWINDHTSEVAIEFDTKERRNRLQFAYTVCVPSYFYCSPWRQLGFEGSYYDDIGIDKSENLVDGRNPDFHYVGTPKHTLEEVKQLVVKGFINSFQFNYEEELQEAIDEVNKRKELMDEVNRYKEV